MLYYRLPRQSGCLCCLAFNFASAIRSRRAGHKFYLGLLGSDAGTPMSGAGSRRTMFRVQLRMLADGGTLWNGAAIVDRALFVEA